MSLVPAVTEMLFAIGAGPQVVAVSSYDASRLKSALPRVGALLDPDIERILSMGRIWSSPTDPDRPAAAAQRAAIPFFDYRHGGLADIMVTMRRLGTVTGHTARPSGSAAAHRAAIGGVRTRRGRLPKPRTLLVFGRERGALRNIYASGGRGFLHDMLEAAGGANVFADIDNASRCRQRPS